MSEDLVEEEKEYEQKAAAPNNIQEFVFVYFGVSQYLSRNDVVNENAQKPVSIGEQEFAEHTVVVQSSVRQIVEQSATTRLLLAIRSNVVEIAVPEVEGQTNRVQNAEGNCLYFSNNLTSRLQMSTKPPNSSILYSITKAIQMQAGRLT